MSGADRDMKGTPISKVLVIDDSNAVRLCVAQQVRQLGHETLCAESVHHAFSLLRDVRPDLVLMDYQMKPVGGDEGCALFKSNPELASVPVVMITGDTMSSDAVLRCAQAGADDFIPKPIALAQLKRKIDAVAGTIVSRPVLSDATALRSIMLVQPPGPYRSMLARLLELSGYWVMRAASPVEAERLLSEGRTGSDSLGILIFEMPAASAAAQSALNQLETLMRRCSAPAMVLGSSEMPMRSIPGIAAWYCKTETSLDKIVQHINIQMRRTAPGLLRTNSRLPFFSVIDFREQRADADWMTGYSHDISPGGLFLKTLSTYPPGTSLELRLRLPHQAEPLVCKGMVAWSNGYQHRPSPTHPAGMGVQFSDLTTVAAENLHSTWKTLSQQCGYSARPAV